MVLEHAVERNHPHHSSAFQEWLWLPDRQPWFFCVMAQPKGPDVAVAHGACGTAGVIASKPTPDADTEAPGAEEEEGCSGCLVLKRQKHLGLGHCAVHHVFVISSYREHFKS